jgi:hypothetical protein
VASACWQTAQLLISHQQFISFWPNSRFPYFFYEEHHNRARFSLKNPAFWNDSSLCNLAIDDSSIYHVLHFHMRCSHIHPHGFRRHHCTPPAVDAGAVSAGAKSLFPVQSSCPRSRVRQTERHRPGRRMCWLSCHKSHNDLIVTLFTGGERDAGHF